ncbi:MAG: alpha/beta hydrolase [Dactylosporangium sp.]|nr:alpha/beta hydrolase [Dactylosporangium sp.]NNJ60860.1 alpha/beta hydrolase [Dactylosporangium sp.]
MDHTSGLAPITAHRHGTGGPQVAVLHGGPGAPGTGCSLARSLADRCTVIEPHQRRGGDVPLTVQQHVADHAAVLPARATVLGWSWGAMLGLSYAAEHPDRVTSLILVGCGTYDQASRSLYQRRLAQRLGRTGTARIDELSRRRTAATSEAERDRLLAELGQLADRAQHVDPLPEPDVGLRFDGTGHGQTWADVLHRQASGQEPAAFRAITCPVLMLHGHDDPHPGPAIRDTLQAFIPQLHYVEFAACGHKPWLERQARQPFGEALARWIGVETRQPPAAR